MSSTSEFPLPAIKTYKAYNNDSGENCLRSQILFALNTQYHSVRQSINTRFRNNIAAREFAQGCLDNSERFICSFFGTYIEELYRELVTTSCATDKEAWLLVSAVVLAVFRWFHEVRADAQDYDALGTPKDRTNHILWVTAPCHLRMTQF